MSPFRVQFRIGELAAWAVTSSPHGSCLLREGMARHASRLGPSLRSCRILHYRDPRAHEPPGGLVTQPRLVLTPRTVARCGRFDGRLPVSLRVLVYIYICLLGTQDTPARSPRMRNAVVRSMNYHCSHVVKMLMPLIPRRGSPLQLMVM